MADEKLNTGPAENISPEAAEPIATPEQAAASEPQQEQTGPTEPGDVVVSFDKINELMAEKRQNARAEVEKAKTPETPEAAVPGETPQPANTEEPKRPRLKIRKRRNRLGLPRAAHPRRIRRPLTSPSRPSETKCPEVMERPRMRRSPLSPHRTQHRRRLLRNRRLLRRPHRPARLRKASWFIGNFPRFIRFTHSDRTPLRYGTMRRCRKSLLLSV